MNLEAQTGTPRLRKVRDVAQELGIGYQAVLHLIHSGALPIVRVPGRRSYRIDQQDVDALILSWKVDGGTVEKVGIKVGINVRKQPRQTDENRNATKNAKTGEFMVKSNWYKDFASVK